MKNTKIKLNKILSVILTLTIVFSTFSGLGLNAASANPYYSKVADTATLDGWKEFFGSSSPIKSTENAGGVWTDKSVFADNSAFTGLTDAYNEKIVPTVDNDSFLVALSAIASNKSIVGYSHIPTDTVLVLDISGSMGPDNNDAVSDLVLASNAAIEKLLTLNNNNRIGVVLYSAEYAQGNDEHYYTLLPIDRYTATDKVTYNNGTRFDTSDDIIVGKYLETNSSYSHNGNEISIASGVSDSTGKVDETTIDVVGGTFIQGGLKAAADLFKGKADANDTVVSGDGFQGGTQRKPVMVLMSDGAPTYASTNYTNPANPNRGSGQYTYDSYAFLTQLTASYLKKQITSYYNNTEALLYTLGMGVGNSAVAESVLDPQNSTPNINDYWEDYAQASNGASVEITNDISVVKDSTITDKVYTNQYFEAENGEDLFNAFDAIVNEIIIQSLYRPTLVENNNSNMEGYIEFIDDIGDFMTVQQIEGIMIGDKLFTGEKLCENFRTDGGELGTIQNPNPLGDNLIWAVQQRLGIEDNATAQRLVTLAYEHGQLSYTDEDNYSNYIGWYADKDGKYLGFWDESHTYLQAPTDAVYINKSYGMLGEIVDGHNVSDLMYVSIQVHTEIVPQGTLGTTDKSVIIPGHAQVIFRVPASLIPVVNYSVTLEGTSYENAKNIEMTISDAEPIRLLFEVGLRDDINEYNIEKRLADNYRTADGKYVLYTNEWSVEQFNNETHPEYPTYIHPTDSINTIAYFEPNYANERYYYTEPTPVCVYNASTGDYEKYSSTTQPLADDGNEYFRQINVFELTGNGNEALHKKIYERISDTALGRVDKSETNGGWNIRKETIHRVYDEIETKKLLNETNTLGYSYFPTVEHIENTHYYADAILGNNGKLTITPVTGISLTKTIDDTLAGTTHDFTFNVDIGDTAATYSVVRSFDGNYTDNGETITVDGDGKGTINVKPGETVLIVGIPVGTNYTIEEYIPSGANYEVSSSSGTTGTIEQNHLSEVKFENTLADGNLVITKQIVHPFATAPDSLYDHVFKFDVELSGYNEGDIVQAYYSTDVDNKIALTISGGKIDNVELRGNQSIVILAKAGTEVTVTENESAMPQSFYLSNTEVSDNKVIASDSNVTYVFTNTYIPEAVTPDITINASKELTGRPWDNDTFTFALYKYDTVLAKFVEVANSRETITKAGDFGSILTAAIKAESFDKVGTYHYSIRELVPDNTYGISYDTVSRDFNVVVTDIDTDGKLEINVVENANHTNITKDGGAYTVTANKFVNTYKADGIAEVIIEINKTVATPNGITYSPEGFEFGVYNDAGNLVSPIYSTDENGKTRFIFTFNADDVDYQNDKVYNYVIKETDTGLGGISYAKDIPFTVTVKDNLDGTISATTNIANTNNGVSVVDVTNVYNTQSIDVIIEATKNLTGKGLENGEFKFDVLSLDTGSVVVNDVTNDAAGIVTFKLPTFTEVGTYNYKVYEDEENANGVTVDTAEYNVTIVVDHDGKGNLIATVNGTEFDGTPINVGEFNNTYTPQSVEVTLEATKTLTGRETALQDNEFEFAIMEKGGKVLQYNATNDANGKIVFNALKFDAVGTYDYIIFENEVDHNGVKVDPKHYNVRIVVDDFGSGVLSTEVIVDNKTITGSTVDAIVFNNTYKAASVDVTLEATKTLTGRGTELKDKEFKFAIKDVDNDVVVQDDATNDADGIVKFNAITFDKAGTYEYVVYENEVNGNGITVDKTQHNVTIVVTDNGNGQLVATVNGVAADAAVNVGTFANAYTAASVDVVLEATKTLSGRDLIDGEFKFDLYDADNAVIAQDDVKLELRPDGKGKIAFEKLTFDKAGVYNYLVYEDETDGNGITVDLDRYAVTVTVTDNNEGSLIAEVKVNGIAITGSTADAIVFDNKYHAASAKVTLEATKTIAGRDLRDGEFKFDLFNIDNDAIAQDDVKLALQENGSGIITFEELVFDKAGVYNYTVYEDETDENGVTVDKAVYEITITVTDNKLGFLVASIKVNGVVVSGSTANAIVFENTYRAASVDVVLEATKTLTGRDVALKDKEFKFALKDIDNDIIVQDDATNNAEGKVTFNTLTFDKVGVYNYVIYENEKNANGITVDKTERKVIVNVTDNQNGSLVATVNDTVSDGTAVNIGAFNNTYKAASVDVVLEATKTLTGRDVALKNKEFKFALAKKDGTVVQDDATNNANGIVKFNTLTFDKVGTYEYVVYENEVDGNGITVDKTQHNVTIVVTDNNNGQLVATVNGIDVADDAINVGLFTNIYKPQSASVTLEATKTLTGRELIDGEFKFDLYDVDNDKVLQDDVALSLQADGSGKIAFAEIIFDTTGTYKYVVYEDEINENGITVDTTKYDVTIVVTDDNKGTLNAKVYVGNNDVDGSTAEAIVFKNAYNAKNAEVTLEATKTIIGRELFEAEFKFALKDANGTVVQDDATNGSDGKVVFDTLIFDKVGEYEYVVYENEIDANGVTVDTTEYKVVIIVTDNGKGNLVAEVKVDGTTVAGSTAEVIVFENNYKAKQTDIVITAKKILDGRELSDGEFEFELWLNDKLLESVKNDANGNITFQNVAIDAAGEYVLTVKEARGEDKDITYDETVYTVTVNVTDNLDGTYSVEYLYKNATEQVEEIVFNNKYTEPTPEPKPEPTPDTEKEPEAPKTGDSVNLTGWLAVVFISGAIIFATGKKLKKLSK